MSGVKSNGDTKIILARLDERFDALTTQVTQMHEKVDKFCDRMIVSEQEIKAHKEMHGRLDIGLGIVSFLGGIVGGFTGKLIKP